MGSSCSTWAGRGGAGRGGAGQAQHDVPCVAAASAPLLFAFFQPELARCLLLPYPQISDLIGSGAVRLEVALSVPLAEAAKAHDQVASGHTRGKVVLTV